MFLSLEYDQFALQNQTLHTLPVTVSILPQVLVDTKIPGLLNKRSKLVQIFTEHLPVPGFL